MLCTIALVISPLIGDAAESWPDALARMPLASPVAQLNRSNCVPLMLRSFQSNGIVRALIFMPGATDEFYLFRRAKARLTNSAPSLLDALAALTNQTNIRATFAPPFLLLHTDEDPLEPDVRVEDEATAQRAKERRFLPHVVYDDRDWDVLQPQLKSCLKLDLRPWRHSTDSWHFYRHSFAGWNLSGWEALQASALAGKSRFTVRRKQVVFEVDPRVRTVPKF